MTASLTYVVSLFYSAYLFYVAEYTALGYNRLPVLSMSIVDRSRWKIFKVLLLTSLFASLASLVDNSQWRDVLAVLGAVIFPIVAGILIVKDSFTSIFNPLTWVGTVSNIEVDQHLLVFMAAETLFVLSAYIVSSGSAGFLSILVLVFSSMLLFRSLGVLIHSNARRLGLPTLFGAYADAVNANWALKKEIDDEVNILRELCDQKGALHAFRRIGSKLVSDRYRHEDEYFERTKHFQSPALSIMIGKNYLDRLVQHHLYERSLEVLQYCDNAGGDDFFPSNADLLITLGNIATRPRDKQLLARLLSGVPDKFSHDPKAGDALVLAAKLFAENLNFDEARNQLERIKRDFPYSSQDAEYERVKKLLERSQT